MRKSARKLASVVWLAVGLVAGPLFVGCSNPQEQADMTASEKIAKAEADRDLAEKKGATLSDNPKLLDAVQGEYDALGTDSSVSPDMKAVLKGRQAQLRYERALNLIARLREKEVTITRHIIAIDQIASQIEGSQKYVKALQSYDPTTANAALKARQVEIDTGDQWKLAAHTAEAPAAELSFPTAAKLQSAIDDLTAKIAKEKSDIDAFHKKSTDLNDQAETVTRKAETETGNPLVADQTKASDARKEATVADAQADSINADLVHLQADLDMAQAQKASVTNTSQNYSKQTETSLAAWESVQTQITAEKKMQQMLIAGGWEAQPGVAADAHPSSISVEAAALATDLKDAAALRKTIQEELGKCVTQFAGAATDAAAVRKTLIDKKTKLPTDADVPVWLEQMETLHPTYFTLAQGAAQTSLAGVVADDAVVVQMLEQMFDGYSVGPESVAAPIKAFNVSMDATKPTEIAGLTSLLTSENTGIEMPKELGDVQKPSKEDVTKAISAVDAEFNKAMDIYDKSSAASDSGQTAKDRGNSILQGKALAQRQWGDFDLMVGRPDMAAHKFKAADDLEAQLPAMPKPAPVDTTPSAPTAPAAPAPVAPSAAPVGGIPTPAPVSPPPTPAPTPAPAATPAAPATTPDAPAAPAMPDAATPATPAAPGAATPAPAPDAAAPAPTAPPTPAPATPAPPAQ